MRNFLKMTSDNIVVHFLDELLLLDTSAKNKKLLLLHICP